MPTLSYEQLVAACDPGGATALSLVTELTPAGGPHAAVAPARSTWAAGSPGFCYQTRYVDGEPAAAVIIDRKQGQLNRVEAAILQSVRDDHPVLSRAPRVQVSYDRGRVVYTDLELPQRVYDSQVRAGIVDGMPVLAHPSYRAVRDSSPADARVLLELSPGSLVFGAWDSTRKVRPARYRSALVGEIIGILADQRPGAERGSGERGVTALPAPGAVVPVPQGCDAVSCRRIIRTQVLSFAVLRQLRFDSGSVGDAACRALLAAYALVGVVRANTELIVRANCDLVEAAPALMRLDARDGQFVALDPPSIQEAETLLERALEDARLEADISWRGQVFEVIGDPAMHSTSDSAVSPDENVVGLGFRPFWRTHLLTGKARR